MAELCVSGDGCFEDDLIARGRVGDGAVEVVIDQDRFVDELFAKVIGELPRAKLARVDARR